MKTVSFVKNSSKQHDVSYVELELPALEPHQCLIKVRAVGICGSDLHMYDGHDGYDWVTYPLVLGHEITGEIVKVGDNRFVSYLRKRIVIDPYTSCGKCSFCLNGESNRCDFGGFVEVKTPTKALRYGFREPGGMSQYMIADIDNCIWIKDSISDEVAAISEALTVSYTAIVKVRDYEQKRILVVGPGPIGLGVAAIAIGAGNKRVDVLGTPQDVDRLTLAKTIGARATFDAADAIFTPELTGYDAVIDCSGHPSVPQTAVRLLKRGGQLVLVGINNASFALPMDQIVRGEITVQGSYGITRQNYKKLLELAELAQYPFDKLVVGSVDFQYIEKGFQDALNKVSGKMIVKMEDSL